MKLVRIKTIGGLKPNDLYKSVRGFIGLWLNHNYMKENSYENECTGFELCVVSDQPIIDFDRNFWVVVKQDNTKYHKLMFVNRVENGVCYGMNTQERHVSKDCMIIKMSSISPVELGESTKYIKQIPQEFIKKYVLCQGTLAGYISSANEKTYTLDELKTHLRQYGEIVETCVVNNISIDDLDVDKYADNNL